MNENLKVGDKLLIVSDRIGNKLLANVELGEVITITGFSENNKILYHHNSLALPNYSSIYKKIEDDTPRKL
jgi:predicted transcriptional regulator